MPYVVCQGNHDVKNQPNKMNEFFRVDDNPLNQAIFGGSYEPAQLQNAYYALTMKSGQKYLFLALEYETRPEVIAWADKVIKQHADHRVFITVHKYMSEEGRLLSKDGLPDPDHLGYNRKPYDVGGVREHLMRPYR